MKYKEFLNMFIEDKATLRELDLSNNGLGNKSADTLTEIINELIECTQLEALNLSKNKLFMLKHKEDVLIITGVFSYCPTIQRLNLSSNSFNNFKPKRLMQMLEQLASTNLQSLDISDNGLHSLDDRTFDFLINNISLIPNLQSLNIQKNNFNDWNDARFYAFCNIMNDIPSLIEIQGIEELTKIIRKDYLQYILDRHKMSSKLENITAQLTSDHNIENANIDEVPSQNLLFQTPAVLRSKGKENINSNILGFKKDIEEKQEENVLNKGKQERTTPTKSISHKCKYSDM